MNRSEFEESLWDIFNSIVNPAPLPATQVPIIWADEDGVRPTPPYVLLNTIASAEIGQASESLSIPPTVDEPDGTQFVRWDEDPTVSIQGIGRESYALLEKIKNALRLPTVYDLLFEQGIAERSRTDIQKISTILDDQTEPRWNIDITFGIADSETNRPGFIDNIDEPESEILPPV